MRKTWIMMSVLVGLAGCSLTFQRHATGNAGTLADVACSPSKSLPWADLAVIGGEVLIAGSGVAVETGTKHEEFGKMMTGVALFAAVIQYASADVGFHRANECKALRAKFTTPALASGTPLH